jgi:small neutral amino acid transporter SnatA (MarC family)
MRQALLEMLVAVNPVAVAAVLRGRVERRLLAAGLGITGAVAVGSAAASDAVLDVLSVTAPTFRVAAGTVLVVASASWVMIGPRLLPAETTLLRDGANRANGAGRWKGLVVPLLIPVLVTPQLVVVSIAVGADDGVLATAVGAGVALVLAGVATVLYRGRAGLWSAAVRFTGLLAAVVALGMIVDGVKAV